MLTISEVNFQISSCVTETGYYVVYGGLTAREILIV